MSWWGWVLAAIAVWGGGALITAAMLRAGSSSEDDSSECAREIVFALFLWPLIWFALFANYGARMLRRGESRRAPDPPQPAASSTISTSPAMRARSLRTPPDGGRKGG